MPNWQEIMGEHGQAVWPRCTGSSETGPTLTSAFRRRFSPPGRSRAARKCGTGGRSWCGSARPARSIACVSGTGRPPGSRSPIGNRCPVTSRRLPGALDSELSERLRTALARLASKQAQSLLSPLPGGVELSGDRRPPGDLHRLSRRADPSGPKAVASAAGWSFRDRRTAECDSSSAAGPRNA